LTRVRRGYVEGMGSVVLSTQMTIDGVITVDQWFAAAGDHDAATRALFEGSAGMLLGRKTYEGLAGYWPNETGPWADLINPMPKFVASRTLEEPLEWNASLIEGDALESVPALKEREGDLAMVGCGELARTLVEHGLIDELWFWVHPAVWGAGERPFRSEARTSLELMSSEQFDSGVTLQRYRPTS
jgi:dihydrofolate reductase